MKIYIIWFAWLGLFLRKLSIQKKVVPNNSYHCEIVILINLVMTGIIPTAQSDCESDLDLDLDLDFRFIDLHWFAFCYLFIALLLLSLKFNCCLVVVVVVAVVVAILFVLSLAVFLLFQGNFFIWLLAPTQIPWESENFLPCCTGTTSSWSMETAKGCNWNWITKPLNNCRWKGKMTAMAMVKMTAMLRMVTHPKCWKQCLILWQLPWSHIFLRLGAWLGGIGITLDLDA